MKEDSNRYSPQRMEEVLESPMKEEIPAEALTDGTIVYEAWKRPLTHRLRRRDAIANYASRRRFNRLHQ